MDKKTSQLAKLFRARSLTVPIFKISLGIMAGVIATFLPIALGYKIAAFSFILGIPGMLFSLDFLAKWLSSKKRA